MTAAAGQASVEYAGLLGLAAVIGAALALVAGPPLVDVLRGAFAGALSLDARSHPLLVPTAADIADVESALLSAGDGLTPDAALLALAQRHGTAQAREVADSLLLRAARGTAPWLGTTRTYRAWIGPSDGPYKPTSATPPGDRDVERATGAPVVTWVTVSEQRRALAEALAHHTSASGVALDLVAAIPLVKIPVLAGVAGTRAIAKVALEDLPEGVESLHRGSTIVELLYPENADVPPELRAGDVVIAWPVQRTLWRDGRSDRKPPVSYEHRVVLRSGAGGLRVVAEELGA
jgi:hypothetical protein